MQLKLSFLSLMFITGCASVNQRPVDQPVAPIVTAPLEYNNAVDKINKGDYAAARQELEEFLRKQPVSIFTQVANFNIGYTYEMERQFSEAAEKYGEVATSTQTTAPKLQAYSLYRSSYCLEAQGDDPKVIAVLTDLLARKDQLDPEVANAEIPARLAAAYSRVGNTELAQKFYSDAEGALTKYRRQADSSRNPVWLAKALYHMGRVNLRDVTWENFEVVTRPLVKAQKFLLEAAEYKDLIWSKKAAEDLTHRYSQLWSIINAPPPSKANDEILKQRAQQQRQWEMTFQLADLLEDLNRSRLPQIKSPYVETIFSETEKISKEIRKLLAQKRVGSELTPSARKRILGQRPLSKLPEKIKSNEAPTMTPPPAVTPSPSATRGSDPNL